MIGCRERDGNRIRIAKINPRMTSFLEFASYWTGVLAVLFTALAAVAGLFSWYFSTKFADQKDTEFRAFQESSKRDIATANARSAEANARAAEANRRAEEERLERVKLETRLAPRRLRDASCAAVADSIKEFAPQSVDIFWNTADPEATDLADDIFTAFQLAGWTLDRSKHSLEPPNVIFGVIIEYAISRHKTAVGVAANALSDALLKQHVSAVTAPVGGPDVEGKPDTIRVRIGKKP